MSTLLLLAMLQVQPDTTIYATLGVPLVIEAPEPVTVTVRVDVSTDSLAVAYERGAAAAQLSLAETLGSCSCVGSGAPGWFYAGVLGLGAAFLYRYWQATEEGDDEDVNVDVDVNVKNEPVVRRGPPYGRGKGHGG